jgi:hypothetical protein
MAIAGRNPVGGGLVLATLAALGSIATANGRACGAERAGEARLVMIRPGTVVGNDAPEGWTDLVLKSVPRLESGDLASLPAVARSTAALFRTVVLAEVRQAPEGSGRYRFERLGLGICVPSNGKDVVVSTADRSGPYMSLGFVERTVLSRVEEEMKKGRLLVAQPDFALFASPAEQKVGQEHVKVWLLYAFLVDQATGRLRTVIWSIAVDRSKRSAPDQMVVLPPRLVGTCGVDVAAERLLGTIPLDWSFAMRSLPPGRRIDLPDDLKAWAVDPRRITADPRKFAARLRAAVDSARPASTERGTGPGTRLKTS